MRFPGIRLVEQTKKFRRIRVCLKKTRDCNSRAFILKAPTKNAEYIFKTLRFLSLKRGADLRRSRL